MNRPESRPPVTDKVFATVIRANRVVNALLTIEVGANPALDDEAARMKLLVVQTERLSLQSLVAIEMLLQEPNADRIYKRTNDAMVVARRHGFDIDNLSGVEAP